MTNEGVSGFRYKTRVPISSLIKIAESGRWYARPCSDEELGRDFSAGPRCVNESPVFHAEVSSARDFVEALARTMLSGDTHGEVEIKCARLGLYGYVQRVLARFARASGPFRCRSVFTPEADSPGFVERWTHALLRDLDVLTSSRRGYLVSRGEQPGGSPDEDTTTTLLERSEDVVLHSNDRTHRTQRASVIRGEPGVHVLVRTPADGEIAAEPEGPVPGRETYLHCKRSLRDFCRLKR